MRTNFEKILGNLRSKYKGWHRVTEPTCHTGVQCIELKEEKNSVFCGSLPVEQAHNKHCMSNRSQDTAGFVTQVVPTSRPLPNNSYCDW